MFSTLIRILRQSHVIYTIDPLTLRALYVEGVSNDSKEKWTGWHHHHSLVFMATLFMMKERIENGMDYPLMSVRDMRILMIVLLFGTPDDFQKRMQQMKNRHQKWQADIDRHYQNDRET